MGFKSISTDTGRVTISKRDTPNFEKMRCNNMYIYHFVTRGRLGGPMTPYPWPTARPGGRSFAGGGVVEILPNRPTPPFDPLDPDISREGGSNF